MLLNFSLLVRIKNHFDHSLTIDICIWSSWYQLQYFFFVVVISGFFYCNSHNKVCLSTYHIFINNSVLSFHFIFQRSCCSVQPIKSRHSWKAVPICISQKKIPSAGCLSPGQPLHQGGFWSRGTWCVLRHSKGFPAQIWCLSQQAKVWWPGGGGANQI